MDENQPPTPKSIKTAGELAAIGATIRAILRKQFGNDRETLCEMRDTAKSLLDQATAPLKGDPAAQIFVDAATKTLDDLFGV